MPLSLPPLNNTVAKESNENLVDKANWSLFKEKVSLDYDDKVVKVALEGHTLPCLHFNSFCKPTPRHLYIFVWFPGEI